MLIKGKRTEFNPALLLLLIVVMALLGLLGYSLLNQAGSGTAKVPFNRPPAFNLKLFNAYSWEGQSEISPAAVAGRPLIINFWASWCIPCRDEAPVLEKLYQQYSPKGVVYLGIAYQDKEADSLAFLKRYGVTYPNGSDSTGEISIEYGTTGIPETWFVSAEGKVLHKYIRPLSEPVLREFLEELVKNNR